MRLSKLLGKTLRHPPSEAHLVSHQLLARAAFVRGLDGGLRFLRQPVGFHFSAPLPHTETYRDARHIWCYCPKHQLCQRPNGGEERSSYHAYEQAVMMNQQSQRACYRDIGLTVVSQGLEYQSPAHVKVCLQHQ